MHKVTEHQKNRRDSSVLFGILDNPDQTPIGALMFAWLWDASPLQQCPEI
jgi:hypothetical protein